MANSADSTSFPNTKDVFDANSGTENGPLISPPEVMRAKSSTAEMQELISKIESLAKGNEVTCKLLKSSLRRIRDEVESVVNKLEETQHVKSKKPGVARRFVLLDIKENQQESGICGMILRDSGNVSRMVALVEYDIEGESLELIGYGQGQ